MTSARTISMCLAAIGLAVATTGCEMFQPHGDPKLAAEAKINSDAARAIALRAQPGTIKEWELEKEAGGSGLRYSFDIVNGGKTYEVGIDAADGKILENGIESEEEAEGK